MRAISYLFVAIAVFLTGFTTWQIQGRLNTPDGSYEASLEPASGGPGAHFSLTDKNGKRIDSEDFGGKFMLVFFGFTHCPDICPGALLTTGAALKELGDDADKIVPIFISVDPERDTSDRLKAYSEGFDERILMLTGTDEEVKKVAEGYKVFYSKTPNKESPDDYMINHSGFIFLMGKDGKYLTHFPHDSTKEEMATKIRVYLSDFKVESAL